MGFFFGMILIIAHLITSYLKALDAIHHQGLGLCLGTFRTSPVDSLYVEGNEPTLDLRRLKLTMQYIVKLKANIDNPTYFSSTI